MYLCVVLFEIYKFERNLFVGCITSSGNARSEQCFQRQYDQNMWQLCFTDEKWVWKGRGLRVTSHDAGVDVLSISHRHKLVG